MAATALLKFQQVANIGADGAALVITDDANVQITNSDNTDVVAWRLELLYAPPGAAIEPLPGVPHVLAEQSNSTPSYTFTPTAGIRGTYRFRLTVQSVSSTDQDIRCIAVPLSPSGIVLPPLQALPAPLPRDTAIPGAKPDELNFDGQRAGWAGGSNATDWKLLNDALRIMNQIPDDLLTTVAWSRLFNVPAFVGAVVPVTAPATTTDATLTTVTSIAVPESDTGPTVFGVRFYGVTAAGSTFQQDMTFSFTRRVGGAALMISPGGEAAPAPISTTDPCWYNIGQAMDTCVVSGVQAGNTLELKVQGIAATTIDWTVSSWRVYQ